MSSKAPRIKPRVLVTRALPNNVEQRLKDEFEPILNPTDELLSRDEIIAAAGGADAILCCPTERFNADLIDRIPEQIKVIATFSVGYEHIDIDAAAKRGIIVSNTPEVLDDATADIAILCLLAAARRAQEATSLVRENRWSGWSTTMLVGKHVTGARLGIFGMGRIGRAVAQRARGFDMEIHYYNRRRLAPDLEAGAIFHRRIESFLKASDFLSLNAPSTDETRGFLNHERIDLLPPGAVVVNTARGDLVDDDALIDALRVGRVAAAGLDVFKGEPNINPAYRELDNVFLLPHIGSATHATRDMMGFTCLDNIHAYFSDGNCPNRVN